MSRTHRLLGRNPLARLLLLAPLAAGCGRSAPPAIAPASSPVAQTQGAEAKESCCVEMPASGATTRAPGVVPARVEAPDVTLVDQGGRPVRFVADLVGDRVAAIQFVFTRCGTTCPGLGLQFRETQKLLRDRVGREFALISVSVDPAFDSPGKMADWGRRFAAGPGWTLATGEKAEVDRLARALGNPGGGRESHQTTVLVLDGVTGNAVRVEGTAAPATLARAMQSLLDAPDRAAKLAASSAAAGGEDDEAARSYFTDAVLIDQSGRPRRFYTDVLRGKTVVISAFFSSCKGVCLATGETLKKLQDRLGDRLDRDVRIVSITVDRANDTPRALAAHAQKLGARDGWLLLTGDRREVDPVLKKLNLFAATPEAHNSLFLVGNLRTGLWKKVNGLADADEIIASVESVINDVEPE